MRKVICIEDNLEMIELITSILKNQGFEVFGAADGPKGLELIASQKPDLVLLDLMMPDMDGWGVYQRMRTDDYMRTVPVIMVTAKSAEIDKKLAIGVAGVQDYITKPFSPGDLVASVNKVLGPPAQPPPS